MNSPFPLSIKTLGFEKIGRMLIEKGANVNAVNKNNDSALLIAAFKGKLSFLNSIK